MAIEKHSNEVEPWFYAKVKSEVELTTMYTMDLLRLVNRNGFAFSEVDGTNFDWNLIKPCYSFWFDFEGTEEKVREWLCASDLMKAESIYVDVVSDFPILRMKPETFARNWFIFERGCSSMGFTACSSDFQYLLEFTDDAEYMLFTNFKVEPEKESGG